MSLSSCSLATWNCRNHRWISNFLPRCKRFSPFSSTHTLFAHPLFMPLVSKSLICFLEWNKDSNSPHTDAVNSTPAHTPLNACRNIKTTDRIQNSRVVPIVSFSSCTVLSRIFWSAQHSAQKISLHGMRGFCIACWLVGSPLKYIKWFSCYLVSSDKHVHWTCGTWLHADLFVECERRYISTIFLSTLLFYNSHHMI